jgi:lysophospholipase L1-like esterase
MGFSTNVTCKRCDTLAGVTPLDLLIDPFWLSTTMHGESVVFIGRDDAPLEAGLLFPPDAILAVTSAAEDIAYVEGADYLIDRQAGRIVRTSGSRMPSATREVIAAADGTLTLGRTVAVTYTHPAGLWTGHVPEYAGARLPRVTGRLQRRERLTICLTGDSISEGYDASGFHGAPPYQPAFGALVASALEQRYGAAVQLHNLATAGWTAADALGDTARIAAAKPDLVIVAFGMNDACYASAGEFAANVSGVVSRVRDAVADVEFVVVSPMLPTPECTWVVAARLEQYCAALSELTGDGVGLADVTTLWSELVARKDPHDLSGNGLNHPNDFGHRVYAQTILGLVARPR